MPRIEDRAWGSTPAGEARLFTLCNDHGQYVRISNWGGVVQAIYVQGADDRLIDVVLGYDELSAYLDNPVYFGAIVGRYANRIARARFELDGQVYPLASREKEYQLHGGPVGFHQQLWAATTSVNENVASLQLEHHSPDGDQGFPGNLQLRCTYSWSNDQRLQIDFEAATDAPTHVNLTNHSYFNLCGKGNIYKHLLQLSGDYYTPTDADQLPTGELRKVEGSIFDLRQPQLLGANIQDSALQATNGYDHNWVLQGKAGELREIAILSCPSSRIAMDCWTTTPGCQLFTTNFENVGPLLKGALPQVLHGGVCLETQYFPNSPNQSQFPSTVLRPEEMYKATTIYAFRQF